MDKELDRSKGTAFACYWKKEDADKVVTQSEALSKETGMVSNLAVTNMNNSQTKPIGEIRKEPI